MAAINTMDPLSIIISTLTVLEIGTKVSKGLGHVIHTWKGAPPAIFALYNELSDLNVVLDRTYEAQQSIDVKGVKYNASFVDALDDHLRQAHTILTQLGRLAHELKELNNLKKKYRWLFKNSEVAHLQRSMRDVRSRIGELLMAYNV